MAIAFRAGSSTNGGYDVTITLTKPTGTAADDILYACFEQEQSSPKKTWTPPSGWTELTEVYNSAGIYLRLWWKRAGGSEGANYTWTWTGDANTRGVIGAYSGCETSGSPFDVEGSGNTGNGATVTALAVTTTVANTMILFAAANFYPSLATLSSMSEAGDVIGCVQGYVAQASAGSSGNKTGTISADQWAAKLVALKEPSGGGGSTPTKGRLSLMGVGV